MIVPPDVPAQARAARAEIEEALEAAGWPWRGVLSAWIDLLVAAEEAAG